MDVFNLQSMLEDVCSVYAERQSRFNNISWPTHIRTIPHQTPSHRSDLDKRSRPHASIPVFLPVITQETLNFEITLAIFIWTGFCSRSCVEMYLLPTPRQGRQGLDGCPETQQCSSRVYSISTCPTGKQACWLHIGMTGCDTGCQQQL